MTCTFWISHKQQFLLHPGRGVEHSDQFVCLCVFLSTNISLEPLDRSSQHFLCRSIVAVARSSSGGVAICYALLVLRMMSSLAVVGRMAMRGKLNFQPTTISGVVIPGRSLMSMNALFLLVLLVLPLFSVSVYWAGRLTVREHTTLNILHKRFL